MDETKWLKAFREGIWWGEPHQWRLEELVIIKMEAGTFFADVEKNQMPRRKLKRITQERRRMARDLYSQGLIAKMERELDGQEIQLYQYLLGIAGFSAVTQNFSICTTATEWKPDMIKEFIWKLGEEFSRLPDKRKRLATPIGKKLSAGRRKGNGESWKGAAIVGDYILRVYDLFQQFYEVTGRGWKKKRNEKIEKGHFPILLIRDIRRFFREEFSPWLDDLTEQDVVSRIDYRRFRKVQRNKNKVTPPSG